MHYLWTRMLFDTAGISGEINGVKSALVKIPPARILFASDYPQEIKTAEGLKKFIGAIRALGPDGETILDETGRLRDAAA